MARLRLQRRGARLLDALPRRPLPRARPRPARRADPASGPGSDRRDRRGGRPHQRCCASAAGCSASTITSPPCWRRRSPHSTCCPTAGSKSGSGRAGAACEYEAMGVDFDTPGRRIAKLKEVVDLVKAHCAGDELACAGDYVNVNGYKGTPPPVQRPHPPIMIGGGKPRVLAYAGREADIVSINTVPFTLRNDDGLTPAGGGGAPLSTTSGPPQACASATSTSRGRPISSRSPTPRRRRLRAASPPRRASTLEVLRDHPNVLVGSADTVVETLQARRESVRRQLRDGPAVRRPRDLRRSWRA